MQIRVDSPVHVCICWSILVLLRLLRHVRRCWCVCWCGCGCWCWCGVVRNDRCLVRCLGRGLGRSRRRLLRSELSAVMVPLRRGPTGRRRRGHLQRFDGVVMGGVWLEEGVASRTLKILSMRVRRAKTAVPAAPWQRDLTSPTRLRRVRIPILHLTHHTLPPRSPSTMAKEDDFLALLWHPEWHEEEEAARAARAPDEPPTRTFETDSLEEVFAQVKHDFKTSLRPGTILYFIEACWHWGQWSGPLFKDEEWDCDSCHEWHLRMDAQWVSAWRRDQRRVPR